MTEQEVYERLAELEEYLYYRMQNCGDLPWAAVSNLHEVIKETCVKWNALTGCALGRRKEND